MYGFCRLTFIPAPTAGAGAVANGLETNTSMKTKNDPTPASTGTAQATMSRVRGRPRRVLGLRGRVLRRALRRERAGLRDEDVVRAQRPLDDDFAAGAEEIGHRALVAHRHTRRQMTLHVAQHEVKAARGVRV